MNRLAVKATGMVTAVGFNSPASCAAIRAGISGVTKANLWDAESGEHISAGKVNLPHWWEGLGKLAELVAPAIHECLVAAKPISPAQIPILLGVADKTRPHRFPGMEDQLLEEVEYRLELDHNPYSRMISRERVSGVIALNEVRQIIQSGKASCCVVAGVDSFLQQEVVEAYIEQRRVLTPANSNGFIPGEAGCAVLVAPSAGAPQGELEIIGMGIGREEATIGSEKAFRGDGMTEAVRAALKDAGVEMRETSYRITDLNGEHFKFHEASLIEGRLFTKRAVGLYDLWHPNEYLGDVGAGIVPCVLALALHAGQHGYAPGARALCHFSNDDGERAALVTHFTTRGGTS